MQLLVAVNALAAGGMISQAQARQADDGCRPGCKTVDNGQGPFCGCCPQGLCW